MQLAISSLSRRDYFIVKLIYLILFNLNHYDRQHDIVCDGDYSSSLRTYNIMLPSFDLGYNIKLIIPLSKIFPYKFQQATLCPPPISSNLGSSFLQISVHLKHLV